MLVIDAIARNTPSGRILCEVSLRAEQGEVIAVLGPTGSGKTSLLRVIMGLDRPDAGNIHFAGVHLAQAGRNLVAAHRRGFSLVFEKTDLLPFLDVEKNILIGETSHGDASSRHLEEILDLLQMRDLRDRLTHTLSGGEQQRVALARSLMVQPSLLLLDEPFRNIDRPSRDRLIPDLKQYLADRTTTTVLVTHDREEAFAFADRIFLLRKGRLSGGRTAEQLYRNPSGEWDARLLGDVNLIPPAVASSVLGFQAPAQGRILVRPEHLEVHLDPPHNATLTQIHFGGFSRMLEFQVQPVCSLRVRVFNEAPFAPGERYRLALSDTRHARVLDETGDQR